jgi:signal transduction histidine kinase
MSNAVQRHVGNVTAQGGMQHLVQVIQELSLARSMDAVTAIVRRAARELTGADGATFVLQDNQQCFYVDEDAISPLWKGHRFPLVSCISGWVMMNRQAVAIEDIYKDSRIPHDVYRPTFVKSLAMVPIRTIDPIGAIGNYWATAHLPTGEEVQLLQSLADITAVTMENVRLYGDLERRVNERTAELSAANESLAAYSHSISHDLRAPMRSIRTYMEILFEGLGDKIGPTDEITAGKIIRNVGRMEKLIDGLLQFSQLGQRRITRTTVAMYDMVQEVWDENKPQDDSRVIDIRIDQLPEARADDVLIRQVWTNLISNAIKYTKNKERAFIHVGCENLENGIVYFVRDNGAGFDMAYAQKLFTIFQRLHSLKEFDGIGIGLSLVQRIIEKHDGRIWAEAKVNEGATFYFTLS